MSLKAGRVGVNPADVDPIDGHISPASISAYTKQEADAKFQPLTLSVPVKYLAGSQIGLFNTVEEALLGSYGENGAMTNEELTERMRPYKTITLTPEDNKVSVVQQYCWQNGEIVYISASFSIDTEITMGALEYKFASGLPKPKNNTSAFGLYLFLNTSDTTKNRFSTKGQVTANGELNQAWGGSISAGATVTFLIMYSTDE